MNIQQANKILADACGVEYSIFDGMYKWQGSEWTIKDPRCREVVRWKFKLKTQFLVGVWSCTTNDRLGDFIGKTIAEAEIACMIKIAEEVT